MGDRLPQGVSLRDATAGDAALVVALTVAAYAGYRDVLVPESGVFRETEQDVRDWFERGGVILAELEAGSRTAAPGALTGELVGASPGAIATWRPADGAARSVDAGTPVGCVRWRPVADGSHLYLGRLAVLPGHRHRGIGAALVAACEHRAVALGLPEVRLGVRLALPHLQGWYERMGYARFGDESRPGFGPIAAWMRRAVP